MHRLFSPVLEALDEVAGEARLLKNSANGPIREHREMHGGGHYL